MCVFIFLAILLSYPFYLFAIYFYSSYVLLPLYSIYSPSFISCVFSLICVTFIPKYSCIIFNTTSDVWNPTTPFSITVTIPISGSSYGANPTNSPSVLVSETSADPVFPPTSILKFLKTLYAVPPAFSCNSSHTF